MYSAAAYTTDFNQSVKLNQCRRINRDYWARLHSLAEAFNDAVAKLSKEDTYLASAIKPLLKSGELKEIKERYSRFARWTMFFDKEFIYDSNSWLYDPISFKSVFQDKENSWEDIKNVFDLKIYLYMH